jgi:hypothetical protein
MDDSARVTRNAAAPAAAAQTAHEFAAQGGRAARKGTDAVAQSAERATATFAEQAQRMSEQATEAARVYADAAHAVSENIQAVLASSRVAAEHAQEAQRLWRDWLNRTVERGSRLPQDLTRCRNWQEVAEAQSQFVQETVHSFVEGSAETLRLTGRMAESALRPIEERGGGGGGSSRGRIHAGAKPGRGGGEPQ